MRENFNPGDSILVDINGGEYPGLFIGYTPTPAFDDVALVQINGQRFSTYTNNIKKHPQEDTVNELEEYKNKVADVLLGLQNDEVLGSVEVQSAFETLGITRKIPRWYEVSISFRMQHESEQPLTYVDADRMMNIPFETDDFNIDVDVFLD